MNKRILALLLTVVMVVSCLPVVAVAEPAEAHVHCVCGKQTVLGELCDSCGKNAVEWTATAEMPTASGHYYLTAGCDAEGLDYTGDVQLAICLHGQTVTSTSGGQILAVGAGGQVTITDCAKEQGVITGGNSYTYGSALRVKRGGTLYMYGGKITGNEAPTASRGTVYLDQGDATTDGGIFYMYGGEISENSAQRGAGIGTASFSGSQKPGKIYILGGKITDNEAAGTGSIKSGGGIVSFFPVEIGGNAQVTGNTAASGPADIYLRDGYAGELVVSEDVPLTGTAKISYANDSDALSISGTPDEWSCGWVEYEGQSVSYTGSQFVLGHFHGEQEYTAISTNVELSKAEGYCYLTKDLNLGGAQSRAKDLHLCLNGHTIKAKEGNRHFNNSSSTPMTLHIEDCTAYTDENGVYHAGKLTGGDAGANGTSGVMTLAAKNVVYLHDGIVTGNVGKTCGAFVVNGEFYMLGGEISGNTAKGGDAWGNGGAFQIGKGGKLVVSGGKISGNEAAKGSAIYANSESVIDISGGEISGNISHDNAAVYVGTDVALTVSGSPVIYNNKLDEAQSNLYLSGMRTLNIGEMTSGAKIGIGAEVSNRTITEACADYSAYFKGDVAEETVSYRDGALFLGTPVTHIHCLYGEQSCTEHENAGFAEWKKTDSLPVAGTYCLTEDVVLTSAASVEGKLILCLNGHTITQSAQKRVFELEEGAVLTIVDCAESYVDGAYVGGQIVGGVSDTGASIFIREGATVNLYGGRITGSKPASADKATSGSAIFLRSANGEGAAFHMYGGEITGNGNDKSWGAAISNGSGSADNAVYINIYGGKIFGNTAATGAAIRLENKGVAAIYGGEICDNTATASGGAIYLSKGASLDLRGGEITGNTATVGGGIYTTTTAGDVLISGSPVVTDNTASGKQNNLYLNADKIITLGDVAEDTKVGVTSATSDRAISTQTETDYTTNFISDSAYKIISYKDNALYIEASADHQHCVCDAAVSGCDHTKQTWTAWESTSTLPTTSGYYYLVEDVQLTAIVKMEENQKIYLCLNGKTVKAAENTGHMILAKGTELSVTDCSEAPGGFTGGSKAYGGVVNVVAGSVLNLYGGELYGNQAPSSEGGAVYLQGGNGDVPGGVFNMYGGKIRDNTAGIGGGIRAAGMSSNGGKIPSMINIYGGEISNNKTFYKLSENGEKSDVQGEGGAIAATLQTVVNIHGGTICDNVSEDDGGAIYANAKAKVHMKGGKIRNNESLRYGGAIFITAADTELIMDGGQISGNKASSGGAVMQQSNTRFTLNGGSISGNVAESSGGGLYISTKTEFVMNGGEISGNTAEASGAGFYALRSKVTLNGGAISNNKAVNRGGAFVASGAEITLNKILLKGNSAKEGGAAYINRSSSTKSDGTKEYYPSVATINDGAQITGNTAKTNCGGVIVANEGVKLTMNGGTISGNTAMNGAGVMTWTGATLILKGGSVSGNTASVHGGGLYISTGSTLRMEGGSVSGNTARNGGGIYMLRSNGEFIGGSVSYNYTKQKVTYKEDGTETRSGGSAGGMYMSGADCNIYGTYFTNNEAEGNGGAIVMGRNTFTKNGVKQYDNTYLNIYGGVFSNNHAIKAGGALLIQSKETVVNMFGGTFKENASDSAGGAIYVSSDTTFNMTGGSVVSNRSETTAGGIYVLRSTVNITGGEINSNTSAKSGAQLVASGDNAYVQIKNIKFHSGVTKLGGGIVVQSQANFTAENCEFYDNMVETGAGGVYVSTRTNATLIGCKFYNNKSKVTAGAVTAANFAEVEIIDCEFYDNAAATLGGAVYANPVSVVTIKNSTFKNCTAGERGGAITCRGSMFLIDSVIENCQAQGEGGAVYTDTNTAGGSGVMRGLVVEGSQIRNNTAGGVGGAFYISRGCRLELYDSKITGNSSLAEGGAIWAYEDLELHNTEITGNSSGGMGYAVYMNDSNYDGHSYYANHNKLSGNTVIKDNTGGDLWMGPDVVFAIVGYGLGEDAYIRLTMDSGVVTSRVLGAYHYEGGDQEYTLTYGDRSMTDPELLPVEQEGPAEDTQPTTEPTDGNTGDGGNPMLYVVIGAAVILLAAVAVVMTLVFKKKSANGGQK